jgi:hypothetical protein
MELGYATPTTLLYCFLTSILTSTCSGAIPDPAENEQEKVWR